MIVGVIEVLDEGRLTHVEGLLPLKLPSLAYREPDCLHRAAERVIRNHRIVKGRTLVQRRERVASIGAATQ